MSYDFRLFKRRVGEDPLITGQRDSDGFSAMEPDPQKEALKRKVAQTLIAHNPQLKIFQFDYDKIAKFEKTSPEEARLKYRHLELNGPEESCNGIQITLFDDEASVAVPFWHQGEKAANTFREIWNYLEIISRETGYLVYDPQLGRILDLSSDFDEVLSFYTGTVLQLRRKYPAEKLKTRPWWKFW